jgi:hypothetical protein
VRGTRCRKNAATNEDERGGEEPACGDCAMLQIHIEAWLTITF